MPILPSWVGEDAREDTRPSRGARCHMDPKDMGGEPRTTRALLISKGRLTNDTRLCRGQHNGLPQTHLNSMTTKGAQGVLGAAGHYKESRHNADAPKSLNPSRIPQTYAVSQAQSTFARPCCARVPSIVFKLCLNAKSTRDGIHVAAPREPEMQSPGHLVRRSINFDRKNTGRHNAKTSNNRKRPPRHLRLATSARAHSQSLRPDRHAATRTPSWPAERAKRLNSAGPLRALAVLAFEGR